MNIFCTTFSPKYSTIYILIYLCYLLVSALTYKPRKPCVCQLQLVTENIIESKSYKAYERNEKKKQKFIKISKLQCKACWLSEGANGTWSRANSSVRGIEAHRQLSSNNNSSRYQIGSKQTMDAQSFRGLSSDAKRARCGRR